MNASLQCFSQTKDLTNYFLNIKNENRIINNNISIKNKNEPQLCPLYLNLIKKLWDKNTYSKDFSPTIFARTVEEMNPLFKEGQPCDCKDFMYRSAYELNRRHSLFLNDKTTASLGSALTIAPKRQSGSLLCKHAYAALQWLINNYSIVLSNA